MLRRPYPRSLQTLPRHLRIPWNKPHLEILRDRYQSCLQLVALDVIGVGRLRLARHNPEGRDDSDECRIQQAKGDVLSGACACSCAEAQVVQAERGLFDGRVKRFEPTLWVESLRGGAEMIDVWRILVSNLVIDMTLKRAEIGRRRLTVVRGLRINQDHGLRWYTGTVPVDLRGCLPRETHRADGVVPSRFLDDGVDVRDLFFLVAAHPGLSDIRIMAHDILVRTLLPHLPLRRGERANASRQRPRDSFESSRHARQTDRADLHCRQLRLLVLQNGRRDAGLVGAIADHLADFTHPASSGAPSTAPSYCSAGTAGSGCSPGSSPTLSAAGRLQTLRAGSRGAIRRRPRPCGCRSTASGSCLARTAG